MRKKSINDIISQVDRMYDNPRATPERLERAEQAAERYENNILDLPGNYRRHREMLANFDSDKSRNARKAYFGRKYSVGEYRDGVAESVYRRASVGGITG